ncbi:MAG: GH3 auxin-responsive promoter family protein [Deltaproteobacteria bacterium]|nr:GH3 auxin-responsive promoter family protein [Deltaproteobacteria bacterium]
MSSLVRILLALLGRILPARVALRLRLWPFRTTALRLSRIRAAADLECQRAALSIIKRNQLTEYGRAHGFSAIVDGETMERRLPIVEYHELAPYCDRERQGESDILVAGPRVGMALERCNAGTRLFPISAAAVRQRYQLQALLQHAVLKANPKTTVECWAELLPAHPARTEQQLTAPIEVLSAAKQPTLVPADVFTVAADDLRWYAILRALIARPLSVLQAQAPGTLILLARQLAQRGEQIVADLMAGRVSDKERLGEAVSSQLSALRTNRQRLERLKQLCRSGKPLTPAMVWPELRVLVCPTHRHAALAAARLADHFGSVAVFDPGYRTAEAMLTSPLAHEAGELLLLGQAIELLPKGSDRPVTLAALAAGSRVRPILTAENGLYRCKLDVELEIVERAETGPPRVIVADQLPQQIRLGPAIRIDEAVFEQALRRACARCSLALRGATSWLTSIEDEAIDTSQRTTEGSWVGRLFSRRSRQETASLRLLVAFEPLEALPLEQSATLVKQLEREMIKDQDYANARRQGTLAAISGIELACGALARRSERRLARGWPDAHAPLPLVCADPWRLGPTEWTRRFDD